MNTLSYNHKSSYKNQQIPETRVKHFKYIGTKKLHILPLPRILTSIKINLLKTSSKTKGDRINLWISQISESNLNQIPSEKSSTRTSNWVNKHFN